MSRDGISGIETEAQSALEWRLSQLEFALRRNVYRPVFGSRYPDFRRILSGKGVEVYFRNKIKGSRADRFWREKVRGKPPKPGCR